jgi:hypothetical protein
MSNDTLCMDAASDTLLLATYQQRVQPSLRKFLCRLIQMMHVTIWVHLI